MEKSTSTTTWSVPATEEHERYYSKHAPKRRAYGLIQTVLQVVHGALAFAAWYTVFSWVFISAPQYAWVCPWLAFGALFTLHTLFRTTWTTFWYDRLDDDPKTDSSVFIPAAILILLLVTESTGAEMYLANQVKPAQTKEITGVSGEHSSTMAEIESSYEKDEQRINKLYKGKLAAATASIDARIRSANAAGEPVNKLYNERAKAVASIEEAKAAELEKALARYQSAKSNAQNRRDNLVAQIDTHNSTEISRFQTDVSKTGDYAWAISIGLLSLIAALGYARVRINVKSGIMPQRHYTVMDAHGNILERFGTAIGDSFNRQTMRAAVALHRSLSPSEAITSFDGTVIAIPGTYNSFDVPPVQIPQRAYQPPVQGALHPDEDDDAIRAKVANKLIAAASRGEINITPEILQAEYEKARTMNGTYASAPIEQPKPVLSPEQQLNKWKNMVIEQMNQFDRTDDKDERREINNYVFKNPSSPIVKEGMKLGLRWGVSAGIVVVGRQDRSHTIPLEKVTMENLDTPAEDEATDAEYEPDALFKHDSQLFKQSINPTYNADGKVCGITYQKKKGEWDSVSFAGVKARWGIYKIRAQKNPSLANLAGLEAWDYAMQLFDEGKKTLRTDISVITEPAQAIL